MRKLGVIALIMLFGPQMCGAAVRGTAQETKKTVKEEIVGTAQDAGKTALECAARTVIGGPAGALNC